ncbi:MAG: hypothetical protein MSH58_12305 [Clostridiales bacterium]|nr:hypothetical protein [Clostridiales bacterium]
MSKDSSFIMAKRLKELREEKKLSHISLSKALKEQYGIDISRDSLMCYEVSDPHHTKAYKNEGMRVEYLRCFSEFYDVSSDYLLGLTDDRNKKPSAVDDLGLSELAVKEITTLGHAKGFEDCIPGLNFLIEQGSLLILSALALRLRDSVRKARRIERSYSQEFTNLSDAVLQRNRQQWAAGQHLEEMITNQYPYLKGQIRVVIGKEAIRREKDDLVSSFEEKICKITGYDSFFDEIEFRETH